MIDTASATPTLWQSIRAFFQRCAAVFASPTTLPTSLENDVAQAIVMITYRNCRIGRILTEQARAGSPLAQQIRFYAQLASDLESPYRQMFAGAFFRWLLIPENGAAIRNVADREALSAAIRPNHGRSTAHLSLAQ